MMDHLERRGSILVALALYWCLHMIVQHVLDMQALALNGGWEDAMIFSTCFESMRENLGLLKDYYWDLSLKIFLEFLL